MARFALLEHTDAPDDPAGRHFDLLLEAGGACRTWRLLQLPAVGGGAVAAVEIPPHRPAWLDHVAGPISGGRGFARRTDAGDYDVLASDAAEVAAASLLVLDLRGGTVRGRLRITAVDSGWAVVLD